MDTGWKSLRKQAKILEIYSFNPHHNGYGLEALAMEARSRANQVSILIIMDTGWKIRWGKKRHASCAVSILIIMDTGWKSFEVIFKDEIKKVSILIIMDTGWKPLSSRI